MTCAASAESNQIRNVANFPVGVRWTATPNRDLTSLVSLPSSLSYSVLLWAVSADLGSLKRITYPVLAVPSSQLQLYGRPGYFARSTVPRGSESWLLL
jgi:hypothetical protein